MGAHQEISGQKIKDNFGHVTTAPSLCFHLKAVFMVNAPFSSHLVF